VPDSAAPYTRRGLYLEGMATETQFTLVFHPLASPQASAHKAGRAR
jgi:hypothetical protein